MTRALTIEDFHQRYVVEGDCWIWTGPTVNSGYGVMGNQGLAHRWSYGYFIGPIPAGYQVDHLCGRKMCVRPEHLEAVTPKTNSRRWADTITHCPQGHAYEGYNLILGTLRRGERTYQARKCRACGLARQNERDRRKRAEAQVSVESERVRTALAADQAGP